jgi:hypothetical protein
MIQALEGRRLLAANVTATLVGGVLVVQGDNKPHSIVIAAQSTVTTTISPGKGTTVNGIAAPATFTGTPPITVDLGSSNDTVVLVDMSFQNVSVNTGGGNDVVVGAASAASQNLFSNLRIDTGGGNDIIHLGNTGVGNDLTIDAGSGNDIIEAVGGTGAGNNVSIQGGTGADLIHLAGAFSVGGSLSVDGGAGADLLLKAGATFTVGGSNTVSNVELVI